jgi:phospholipid transport system substrate-binding protein
MVRRRGTVGVCALAAVWLLCALAFAPAAHADPGVAMTHVQHLLSEGQRVSGGSASDRESGLGRLLDRDFDIELIARTALGAAYGRMSDAERTEYLALFREHVVLSVVRQVVLTPVQDVVVIEARDGTAPDSMIVTRVVDAQNRVRLATWRVRDESGRPKVIDVVVDGVSLATTRADELRSVLQRNGGQIAALLAVLRAQNAQMRQGPTPR